ncbi:site-2 protease family protein [Pseudenhygromyxa sp. WMMC2535]|uniref:site-2 protease family protein n=1 Tax=Pseudenhygromyxa sp. WMMC2535 TaxID=2712867 RepID=UPI0015547964|nr:site-2 protease family protein [Pseudenhygromyxa sp. WMMC2535]NVB42170.1 site-2 protease family protein [Pseudenhygromyxa sp. WMMC2535]
MSSELLSRIGIYLICLIISIGVHEYCHALVADRLGDDTPGRNGRLTLNPIVHADPVGTLIMPIVAALSSFPLLGWGRPVETQPRNYTRKLSMRKGMALVAAAGPFGNFALVLLVLGIAAVLARTVGISEPAAMLLQTMVTLNVVLMVFNLLPLHPLDGGKILAAFLPARFEAVDEFLLRYGPWILLGLVVFGGRYLGYVFTPIYALAMHMLGVAISA